MNMMLANVSWLCVAKRFIVVLLWLRLMPQALLAAEKGIEWIPHDRVEILPASATEEQVRFLPFFSFTPGTCLPAPAIDREGRLGAGLKASGRMNGNCLGFDAANIYTQTLEAEGFRIHAYALYFPKDGSSLNSLGGHRHDWEHVLVWTQGDVVRQVTFRQHSGWYTLPIEHIKHEGSRILVYVAKAKHGLYHSRNNGPGGLLEGICYFCDTRADPGLVWDAPHRLVAFELMNSYQQWLLQQSIWGSANSPFRRDVFAATVEAILAGEVCRDRGCQCQVETGNCPGFP